MKNLHLGLYFRFPKLFIVDGWEGAKELLLIGRCRVVKRWGSQPPGDLIILIGKSNAMELYPQLSELSKLNLLG
jgi:hypothetical protein